MHTHDEHIDLRPRTPDAIAAAMPKDGRRGVKRADRVATEAGCVMAEEKIGRAHV